MPKYFTRGTAHFEFEVIMMSVPSSNKNDMSSDENEYFYKKHLIKDLCKKASAGPKKRMIVVESSKTQFIKTMDNIHETTQAKSKEDVESD